MISVNEMRQMLKLLCTSRLSLQCVQIKGCLIYDDEHQPPAKFPIGAKWHHHESDRLIWTSFSFIKATIGGLIELTNKTLDGDFEKITSISVCWLGSMWYNFT